MNRLLCYFAIARFMHIAPVFAFFRQLGRKIEKATIFTFVQSFATNDFFDHATYTSAKNKKKLSLLRHRTFDSYRQYVFDEFDLCDLFWFMNFRLYQHRRAHGYLQRPRRNNARLLKSR